MVYIAELSMSQIWTLRLDQDRVAWNNGLHGRVVHESDLDPQVRSR